jgi:hypothetical protein
LRRCSSGIGRRAAEGAAEEPPKSRGQLAKKGLFLLKAGDFHLKHLSGLLDFAEFVAKLGDQRHMRILLVCKAIFEIPHLGPGVDGGLVVAEPSLPCPGVNLRMNCGDQLGSELPRVNLMGTGCRIFCSDEH